MAVQKAVTDVCWSPYNSTLIACVNEGGLELWDLSESTLDPILQHTPTSTSSKLSRLSFSLNSDCLLVGDSEGQTSVYQLRGLPQPPTNQIDALRKVIQSVPQVN